MHRMAQGVARRVFTKERSSTCHHVSHCSLSLHTSNSSSLSSVSTSSLISSPPLSWSSSSIIELFLSFECLYIFSHFFTSSILVIILHVGGTAESTADPQIEECCTVAIHNPLTGYEPNQLDNSDYSETCAVIFQNESVDIDTEPSHSCDAELDDELIGKALSLPLLIQEREEPANGRQAYHSHE